MRAPPPEPGPVQCNDNSPVEWDGRRGFACWYPQMGGYTSTCVVFLCATNEPDNDGCFEAFVWHDGTFPFSETDGVPALIHHCMADQFIWFGQLVKQKQREAV